MMSYRPPAPLLAVEVSPDPLAGQGRGTKDGYPSPAAQCGEGVGCVELAGLSTPALPTRDTPPCLGWGFPTPFQPYLPAQPLAPSRLPLAFPALTLLFQGCVPKKGIDIQKYRQHLVRRTP